MQLVHRKNDNQVEILSFPRDKQKVDENLEIFRNSRLFEKLEHYYDNFSSEQKSEILDRFFSRQIP